MRALVKMEGFAEHEKRNDGRVGNLRSRGDLETASLKYGAAAGGFTDFSANINPLGPPPGLLEALRDALPEVVRYPDPGHRRLVGLLSERYRLAEASFVIGNGAAENMALALLALSPGKVGIVEPCFSEYRSLSERYGAEVVSVFGTEERDFKADPDELTRLIRDTDMVFVGQPNNPNGVQYGLDELRRFAEAGKRTAPMWRWTKRLSILSRRSGAVPCFPSLRRTSSDRHPLDDEVLRDPGAAARVYGGASTAGRGDAGQAGDVERKHAGALGRRSLSAGGCRL